MCVSRAKSECAKYKSGLEENNSRVKVLKEELDREKQEQKKQLDMLDQEVSVMSCHVSEPPEIAIWLLWCGLESESAVSIPME